MRIKSKDSSKGFTGGNSKTIGNTKINKKKVRVDIEYPTGESSGNVLVQVKGSGGDKKVYLDNLDDLAKLEKSIRKNKDVTKWAKKH